MDAGCFPASFFINLTLNRGKIVFYKIRNNILFRQYEGHGYITDNSEFGYRFLNDVYYYPGENFVSESGAVMLSVLTKSPQNINDITHELMNIFVDVEYDVLKEDTIEFYQWFVELGYLSFGETYEACYDQELIEDYDSKLEKTKKNIMVESCDKSWIDTNDFLRSIHFDIASICNERCIHCYIPHDCKTKVIDSELFYRVLEEGRKMNIIHVTLSGGEPLLHKDISRFLKKCRELDLSVNVLSNLTMLNDDIIFEMKKNPLLSVQTSLYSMDPTIHDAITQQPGSFEKTKKGILKLLEARIPVQISCPVMKLNKESIRDVIVFGKKINIAVAIEPVIFASYDHMRSNLSNRLSLEELEDVLEQELSEGYEEVFRNSAIEKESFGEDNPVCSVCRYSFCVSVDGDVFPCAGWQTNIIGNLNQQTVEEVWLDSEKIKSLRKIKRKEFPKCVTCEDRGYCTVCMMSNANESLDGNIYEINDFHCKVAAMIHRKVER